VSRDPHPPRDPSSPRELPDDSGVEPGEDLLRDLSGETERSTPAPPDFDEIVRQHGRRLYVLAYRLTGDRAEAEDLSQEALVRAHLASGGFRGEADFYTYLYRTVLNLWRNRVRSRRLWRIVPLGGSTSRGGGGSGSGTPGHRGQRLDLPDPAPGPHEWLAAREQAARLDRALAAIGPEFRAVLVLRVAEGLEYTEIAAALGIGVGTVRSRLARARSRIRELLTR
jgi:RNA polymerase sigma-70 factor (ECF subfamily)